MSYWMKVLKKILYIVLTFVIIYVAYKFAIFYMPFLVAFLFSLVMEPIIKFIMRKLNFTRRTSSIIIFIIVLAIIIGIIALLVGTLISEASHFLGGLNGYVEKFHSISDNITNKLRFDGIEMPEEIKTAIQDSSKEFVNSSSNWVKNLLTGFLNATSSIPTMAICIIFSVIFLYFLCVDKIYIIDQIEHHFPEKWVKTVNSHLKDITGSFGGYLKAEVILILVSFVISLIGLYILKFAKFNIEYPLLIALFIGFVDALPILGSGTVMIPWAIISAINGDIKLGIAVIILFAIMNTTRQFLEPKLVSKHIGTHPIFTLIAMYTGFKIIGVFGLILGPIILIIIKNVFSNMIDEGIVKSIFENDG